MLARWATATIVVATAAIACGEITTGATRSESVSGQYTLIGIDGIWNLPCCGHTDSTGTAITIRGGLLQVGWNTPIGAYEWDIVRYFQYSGGTSQQIQSNFSSGRYAWDGRTLALVDSGGAGTMTGTFVGGQLTVSKSGHEYAFLKLPQLPH